jgi:hypothetical protein
VNRFAKGDKKLLTDLLRYLFSTDELARLLQQQFDKLQRLAL